MRVLAWRRVRSTQAMTARGRQRESPRGCARKQREIFLVDSVAIEFYKAGRLI
jgi:hypothetical protein